MSGAAAGEDRFDRLEREHDARSRAAAEMAAVLGVGRDDVVGSADNPRGDKGRFVGSADAGEKGLKQGPPKSYGDMMLDAIYGGDHSDGVSWTTGSEGA